MGAADTIVLELYESQEAHADPDDPVDAIDVRAVLAALAPHHRAVLTLRYLDGLPVDDVARHLDRSVHATESLLMRAKAAYHRAASHDGAELPGGVS